MIINWKTATAQGACLKKDPDLSNRQGRSARTMPLFFSPERMGEMCPPQGVNRYFTPRAARVSPTSCLDCVPPKKYFAKICRVSLYATV